MTSRTRGVLRAAALGAALMLAPFAAMAAGTLTVALETDVRGFDAVKGGVLGASGGTVSLTVHDPLVERDVQTGEYSGVLAQSWEQAADGLSWTFKLKRGVKFHDGTEFTARDAADHINRILDPDNKSRSRSFITAIKGATALDSHTVRYDLAHPWQPLLGVLSDPSMIGLIPSHTAVEADSQNRSPVGTGPYRFVSWAGGDRIVVEKNPDYHRPGIAAADRIVFRILPDTQARYAALQAGEVDVIWTDRGNTIVDAQKDPDIQVVAQDGKGAKITFLNASKPPLDDQRVRQALSYAWNQQAILAVTWKNTVPFARHPYGPGANCAAGYLETDAARAKALLADYGKPVSVEMIHTTTPRGRELGEVMQQLYKQIGVELKLVPVDQNTLVKKVFTNDYQISGWRISDSSDVGPQVFALSFSKSSYNLTRFTSPELDKAALAMRTAATPAEREKHACTVARMINDSGHMLYRGGNRYYVLAGKNVKNVGIASLGVARVASASAE